MRNLLEEFRANHGIRYPTILGVREHVFTGRYYLTILSYFTNYGHVCFFCINLFDFILLQCVFAGVIYVETGNQFRYSGATCSCLPQVSKCCNYAVACCSEYPCSLLLHFLFLPMKVTIVSLWRNLIAFCYPYPGFECTTDIQMFLIGYFI